MSFGLTRGGGGSGLIPGIYLCPCNYSTWLQLILRVLQLHPGHIGKEVAAATCQDKRRHVRVGTKASKTPPPPAGEAGARETRRQCQRTTKRHRANLVSTDRPSQAAYLYDRCIGTKSKHGVELCQRRCGCSPGSLKCIRVRSVMQAP